MDSSTHRKQTEEEREADIRRQIALLQAQLKGKDTDSHAIPPSPSTPRKRKTDGHTLLAPATPSPKKRKVVKDRPAHAKHSAAPVPRQSTSRLSTRTAPLPTGAANSTYTPIQPAASSVLTKLASFVPVADDDATKNTVTRSSAFGQQAAVPPVAEDNRVYGAKRDDNLALIEDLEIGPYEHKAPFDDPHFEQLEPNSGIRLSSRSILHDDFQDYLRGRYYLSPSKLYSVIRLLPSKQGYDVPVEGDWVTIAVVAERGPVKYTKAPVGIGKDERTHISDDEEDDMKSLPLDQPPKPANPYQQNANRWKGKAKQEPAKPSGKRYMNLKLIDFGCRTRSSASGGKSTIRGDAFLTLLLFEADRVDVVERDDGVKEKIYKGGSRGAFEKLSKLKEGTVVAFLNPRILKPFQHSASAPHPTDNILAITPESADAIAVIGQSRDLGMCTIVKRDGKVCGGWCDKRVSDVCEWHIQHAVQRKRAGRAEFSTGTSSMASSAKRKPDYDPSRQWGLKPDPDKSAGTDATYVVSGHIVSGRADPKSLFISESLGRDAQAKAARQGAARDADRTLQTLLKRDKEGMRAVKAARDYSKKLEKMAKEGDAKGKGKTAKGKDKEMVQLDSDEENDETEKHGKNAFSATLIKSLGFDPTAKDGRRVKDADVEKKLKALASAQACRKVIALGPRPGKLKSTVRAPDDPPVVTTPATARSTASRRVSPTSDGSDSPLLMPESDEEDVVSAPEDNIGQTHVGNTARPNPTTSGTGGPEAGMVDLDSSDVDY